jgi:ferredoxin
MIVIVHNTAKGDRPCVYRESARRIVTACLSRRILARSSRKERRMSVIHSRHPEAGTVAIDESTCRQCGLCADVCPTEVLQFVDDRVLISWRGRQVVVLAGTKAKWFLERAEGATAAKLQLLLARATGNFKRGNERGR